MVSILDEAIGNITNTLKEHGMFEDTVIIFSADVSVNFSLKRAETFPNFNTYFRYISLCTVTVLRLTCHKFYLIFTLSNRMEAYLLALVTTIHCEEQKLQFLKAAPER